jgi:UPF0755 protein
MPKGRHKGFALFAATILLLLVIFTIVRVPIGSDRTKTSFVVKRGTKTEAIAHLLKREHRVRSEYLFLLCSFLLHKGRIIAGEYELSPHMSILDIAGKMADGDRKMYTLRIVEGYNLYTIGCVIEKAGIMDGKDFLKVATDPDFLRRVGVPSDSLEGYLAPDTYFYSKEVDVDEFLEKIAQRTVRFLDREDMRLRMQELGMDAFQVISFASIIEKEAKMEEEKRLISAVFHNRLRLGMSLDADPTVIYGRGEFGRDLTKADLAADTPYNTYRMKGLPKGPICSPSRSSIVAALYPDQSDVLYFVSRNDGTHVFSKTLEDHSRFVAFYQRKREKK